MATRTEAIKAFLTAMTHPDLAELYSYEMECQVNVAQDNGQRIQGDYKGKLWHGWQDLNTGETWKPIRIPYNAKTTPTYDDREMTWDLARHAEGIGMTGWDWVHRCSRWVGFDFDAIVGHSDRHQKKLTDNQLKEVQDTVTQIPWVTLRRSTSGKGLHLYVLLPSIPTNNHDEHAALARAILGLMAAITGYDLKSKIDAVGGNLWVWHRKQIGTDGLTLIKQGEPLPIGLVPPNWHEHLTVITGRRTKVLPEFIESDQVDEFDELSGQRLHVELDSSHRKLLDYIREHSYSSWWDADNSMLVTHTHYLKNAHRDLSLKGIFATIAMGTESPDDINCFAYPMRKGAWVVRRYTKGVQEDPSWSQDATGWTRCFFNKEPDFETACRASGAIQNAKGAYVFREAEIAIDVARSLGMHVSVPSNMLLRRATLRLVKDRVVLEIDKVDDDSAPEGFLSEKKSWQKVGTYVAPNQKEVEIQNYDDTIRHTVSETGENAGWAVKSGDKWCKELLEHAKLALESLGNDMLSVRRILGHNIIKNWTLVNCPFQPEYPGDRTWNRDSAQFLYPPNLSDNRSFPTWTRILDHLGKGLDRIIVTHPWAKANGILTGGDYLKIWLASCFQMPREPLPYLFFYGNQGCGKSILYEGLETILNEKAIIEAKVALESSSNFNGEIATSVLCYVNEVDLSKGKDKGNEIYNRIKNWVTAIRLGVHPKGKQFYMIPNTSHWIQIANDPSFCPVFPGDTRITMMNVPDLDPADIIPKTELLNRLKKEGPDFIGECLSLDIPISPDRFVVPVIETEEKRRAIQENMTQLEVYLNQFIHPYPGKQIKFKDFSQSFLDWLEPQERQEWNRSRISKGVQARYPTGNSRQDANQVYMINCHWEPQNGEPLLPTLILKDGKIYHAQHNPVSK